MLKIEHGGLGVKRNALFQKFQIHFGKYESCV